MSPSKKKEEDIQSSGLIDSATTTNTNNKSNQPHPYKVLTPNAIINLPKFQYNGIDRSLTYKYILSPLAQYCVDNFTPPTLAPNTITFFGLCLMFASYLHIYYHCPTLEHCAYYNDDSSGNDSTGNVPGYIFLLNGIAILIYQTLDNMDGKQARKTGSSSPLGLLFDHGCDAINSIFGSVTWICAFGLVASSSSSLIQIWIMVFIPMSIFYVATYEEYYTHKLDLPIFNGPSEGLILASMVNITTWWYGQSFWHGTEFFEILSNTIPHFDYVIQFISNAIGINTTTPIQNYNIVLIVTVISSARELVSKVFGVVTTYGIKTMKDLVPMVLLMTWSLFIVGTDSEMFRRNERYCFHLVSLLFVNMVSKLMIDHTSGNVYNPFQKVLIPFFLLYPIVTGNFLNGTQIDMYIQTYTWFMFAYFLVNTKIIIREICDLLGIWCFDIVTPREKKVKQI